MAEAQSPKIRLLVVEDNRINREVIKQLLIQLGQEPVIAVDGADGVRIASSGIFDLILMDVQMPTLDGIEATKVLRAAGNTTPIVAMTANASEEDRLRCLSAGMTGFETKPITMARLRTTLQTYGATAGERRLSSPLDEAVPVPSDREADFDRFRELVAAVGEDSFRTLLNAFVADVSHLLLELRHALAVQDPELVDRTLHSIKGASYNMGFPALGELADASRRAPLNDGIARSIEHEVRRVEASVKKMAA